MEDHNAYILNAIRLAVWSGFYELDAVDAMIDDLLEGGENEALLRAAIAPEFARKAAAELTWPEQTDCDRLWQAFEWLNEQGIVALHNAGYTMSDGLDDVREAAQKVSLPAAVRGYCFYHGQDTERAVDGGGLNIAFGSFDHDADHKKRVGTAVRRALQGASLVVEWDENPEKRLYLPTFDWKLRTAA
ncbi:MAG: DUF6891 domain-containing protein [Janthinobacterium lividum]